MKQKWIKSTLLAGMALGVAIAMAPAPGNAAAFGLSFTGSFSNDAHVDTETFTLAAGNYTFRTVSYAGGTLENGLTIPSGGFDPILTLFAGSAAAGTPIVSNDDGGSRVPADPVTGSHWDSWMNATVAGGTYTVAISQYNNFWNAGSGTWTHPDDGTNNTFTSVYGCSNGQYCDAGGHNRTHDYAWDLVPEPASLALLGAGLAGLGLVRRRKAA